MKKRMTAIFLVFALVLLCACGQQENTRTEDTAEDEMMEEGTPADEKAMKTGASADKNDADTDPVRRRVTVSELYGEEGEVKDCYGYGYPYSYHVPQIEDDTPDANKINEDIAMWYGKLVEEGLERVKNDEIPGCNSVAYELYHSGDVLSVVLKCAYYYGHYEGYCVYNYDTAKGVRLTNGDILAMNGVTEEEYLYAVRRAAAKCYDDRFFSDWENYAFDSSPGAYQERRLYTISDWNITADRPLYPNDDNVLQAIVPIGCHTGVDWLYETLALDLTEDATDVDTAEYGDFLTIKRRDGTLTLRFKETEQLHALLEETSSYMVNGIDVPYGREVKVNGLYGSYTRIFCESIGEPGSPYVFLLTEEGRVEYIDVMDCLYAGYFCASGPLVGAEDVKDFVLEDEEGFQNIYAVTGSGERLDLNDLTMLDRYNMAPNLRGTWSNTRIPSQDNGGYYDEFISMTLSDGNGDNFELIYSQSDEEYITGISGNLVYLGMTEEGAIYAWNGWGLYGNGLAWRGAIALSLKEYTVFGDYETPAKLYLKELGGDPLIGDSTGDIAVFVQSFG